MMLDFVLWYVAFSYVFGLGWCIYLWAEDKRRNAKWVWEQFLIWLFSPLWTPLAFCIGLPIAIKFGR